MLLIAIAAVVGLAANACSAEEDQGVRVSAASGFLRGFDRTDIWVEGLRRTHAGGDIVVDLKFESPPVRSTFVFAQFLWRFGEMSPLDDLDVSGYIDADGSMLATGVGYRFSVGESTVRLCTGIGYSWESLDINFVYHGLERVRLHNNSVVGLLGSSMSLPLFSVIDVTLSFEVILYPDKVFDNEFDTGRPYRVETAHARAAEMIGLTWKPQ
jgi:hypothetical protein